MRVATFNLYQYAEPKWYWYQRNKNNRYKRDQWRTKQRWILDRIEYMQADVIAFQEVFSIDALRQQLEHAGYPHFVVVDQPELSSVDEDVFTRPVCALASRLPIRSCVPLLVDEHYLMGLAAPSDFRFSRIPLRVTIESPELGSILFYVVHLKSKRPIVEEQNYPKSMPWIERVEDASRRRSLGHISALLQRGVEATLVYQSMMDDYAHTPEQPIILLGDLNDNLSAISTQALVMQGHVDQIGTIEAKHWPDKVSQYLFNTRWYDSFNLAQNTKQQVRPFTNWYKGTGNYLDYILVSNHLNHHNPNAIGYVKCHQVISDHLSHKSHHNKVASDHGMVLTEFAPVLSNQVSGRRHKRITRQDFVDMAGGIYQSGRHYGQLSEEGKWEHFWSFFFEQEYTWARSIYAGVSVDTLFDKNRHSIEHIIPESFLGTYLKNKKVTRNVRYGAVTNPFNFAPADRKANSARSNFPFTFHTDTEIIRPHHLNLETEHYITLGVTKENRWVVPPRSRGDIARAILYMVLVYEIDELYNTHIDTLVYWAKKDEPSAWEIAYNQWVAKRLGVSNPFIDSKERSLALLNNDTLMRSPLFNRSKDSS